MEEKKVEAAAFTRLLISENLACVYLKWVQFSFKGMGQTGLNLKYCSSKLHHIA